MVVVWWLLCSCCMVVVWLLCGGYMVVVWWLCGCLCSGRCEMVVV